MGNVREGEEIDLELRLFKRGGWGRFLLTFGKDFKRKNEKEEKKEKKTNKEK